MGTGLMLLHNNSSNNPSVDAGTLGRSYKAEPFYIPALDLSRPPAPEILPSSFFLFAGTKLLFEAFVLRRNRRVQHSRNLSQRLFV